MSAGQVAASHCLTLSPLSCDQDGGQQGEEREEREEERGQLHLEWPQADVQQQAKSRQRPARERPVQSGTEETAPLSIQLLLSRKLTVFIAVIL